jgi:hypothetical protein
MSWLLDKLTGRSGKIFPPWEGEVHDARCHFEDITFDPATGKLRIRCWRPLRSPTERDSSWEELLVVFSGLVTSPTTERQEVLPYYELSTVYFDPGEHSVHICFHAGLSIHYSAQAPDYSFLGSTGKQRNWQGTLL